jgi:hypothetical protein
MATVLSTVFDVFILDLEKAGFDIEIMCLKKLSFQVYESGSATRVGECIPKLRFNP